MTKQEASLETNYGIDRELRRGSPNPSRFGLRRILLLTNHPPRAALEGFELEVAGNVPLGEPEPIKEPSAKRKTLSAEEKEQRT